MALPPSLKSIKPFVVIAKQFEKKDMVVSYYVLLHAVKEGIVIAKVAPDAKTHILKLMDNLDQYKKTLKSGGDDTKEAVDNEVVGQAHVEEVAFQLFDQADALDRNSQFSKSLAKMFFSASQIFMSLKYFGELSEEIEPKMKYAKWKAVELDKCFKNGTTPTPGPPGGINNPLMDEQPAEQEPGPSSVQPGYGYGEQPGPSSVQPGYGYGEQPGPSSVQPGYGYGEQPGSSMHGQQLPPVGFDLPPVPSQQPASIQPQLPPEIKPVPKPRHETHTPPAARAQPPPTVALSQPLPVLKTGGALATLTPDQTALAIKNCKFAVSSLDYNDNEGALEFLTKAMNLIRTGNEN